MSSSRERGGQLEAGEAGCSGPRSKQVCSSGLSSLLDKGGYDGQQVGRKGEGLHNELSALYRLQHLRRAGQLLQGPSCCYSRGCPSRRASQSDVVLGRDLSS